MSLLEAVKGISLVDKTGKGKDIFDYAREVQLMIIDYPELRRKRNLSVDRKLFLDRVKKII